MYNLSYILSALILVQTVAGVGELTGFPANPYDPYCAMSCLRSLYSLMLSCSSMADTSILGTMTMKTSSSCWANNTPYLTSLAWCMHEKCQNVPAWKLEYFWATEATGQSTTGETIMPPKWTYAEALEKMTRPPTVQLSSDATWLNDSSLVSPEIYKEQWNVLVSVQEETTRENAYGIAILVTGFGVPILLTAIEFVPFLSTFIRIAKPYLVWPSTIGTYQVRPLPYLLGNAPSIGQSLYILLFILLNIILTSVNYHSRQPNAWYSNTWREIMAYVLYRSGNLAYIISPLIFLFGGRNNILLWLTNWSHSTFMVLHRWVARVFAVQVLLHSILAVVLYKAEGSYDTEVKASYWIWGIVATLCVVFLTFGSGLWLRKRAYELFLLIHIVLSVILIVGCWYHVYDLYAFLGGMEDWIYAMAGVWFFDRLARVVRILTCGPRRANVTEIGDSYFRIDVPGISWGYEPGKHVYLYLPTLNKTRPWENHPFSVLPTALLSPRSTINQCPPSMEGASEIIDAEKGSGTIFTAQPISHRSPTAGLTLYVRISNGMTRTLRTQKNVLTFLEGPYPNNSTSAVLRCDRLLLIAGGIGITGILPFVQNHRNAKLAWGMKESARCLLNDLKTTLDEFNDTDVRIGRRLDISDLLKDEMEAGWEKVGIAVSGPGGFCDDVRAAVVMAAKTGKAQFELEVEAYSW